MHNVIHESFKHGKNFKIGYHCIIEEDVEVGDNVEIQHFVLLKNGTKIGNNVFVDSYVRSSGCNRIGNNITIRFGATIARAVTIEDDTFISPNVMTIYSTHQGKKVPGTIIGKNCHIGTGAVIGPGIKIKEKVVIGALAFVSKDCTEEGIYGGVPAKLLQSTKAQK